MPGSRQGSRPRSATEANSRSTQLLEARKRDSSVQLAIDELKSRERKLEVKQQALVKVVAFYKQHLEQYATAREAVKNHEADVRFGNGKTTRSKVVCYRDFVNHHDCDGSKIHDYVLVFIYRDSHDLNVQSKKYVVHNLTSDPSTNKADTAMVHDFVDHHLSGRSRVADDLFSRLKAASHDGIIDFVQSGDHGPQLSSNDTIMDETTFFAIYQVNIHGVPLCSYHAYNPCDAGGSVPVRLDRQAAKKGEKSRGSAGSTFLINTSMYANHAAFNFGSVNKPVGKLYKVPTKFHLPAARQQCDIRYDHLPLPSSLTEGPDLPDGTEEHTMGVVRYREVYGKKPYVVHDFMEGDRPATWGKRCHNCSNSFPVSHLAHARRDAMSLRGCVAPFKSTEHCSTRSRAHRWPAEYACVADSPQEGGRQISVSSDN